MKKSYIFILSLLLIVFMYSNSLSLHADSWGSWSTWQNSAVSASASRQVETRQVIDSYTMETYVYTDNSSPSLRGYWPNPTGNTPRNHAVETWPKATLDSARWVISPGTYYNSPDNDNCDGMVHDAAGYVVVEGQGHDYVPFFIKGTNYKTQYRYRDIITVAEPGIDNNTQVSAGPTSSSNTNNSGNKSPNTGNTTNTASGNSTSGSASGTSSKQNKTSSATNRIVPVKKTYATKNRIKVSWKRCGKCTGYKICYSSNAKFKGCKTITVKKGTTTSVWIKGLVSGKKYYIRIRGCWKSKGRTYYTIWSAGKCVQTAKAKKTVKQKLTGKKKSGKSKKAKLTKKMTVYDDVIKDGNTVYCIAFDGIYRVNLKNHKTKKLVSNRSLDDDIDKMSKKGNYIYYVYEGVGGMYSVLYRVKCTGGKPQRLAGSEKKDIGVYKYAISGSKIYYNYGHPLRESKKTGNEVIKINGKSVKKTNVKVKMVSKKTNAKGYKTYHTDGDDWRGRLYLKTPKGKIYLGRWSME